jgi:hypothetical protein
MLKLTLKSVCLSSALLTASVGTIGCADGTSEEAVGESGTLSAALTTTGSDGASYAFPPGTQLTVTRNGFTEYLPLDGTETVLQKRLPAGTYTVGVYYGVNDVTLLRTESAVTTTVDAEWSDPQPVTFEIVDDQTTSLVLHFTVTGLGDVTFDTGTLEVTAEVDNVDEAQAGAMEAVGFTNIYSETYADPTAAYASALDVETGVDYWTTLELQASGAWTQYASNVVCKEGSLIAGGSAGAGLNERIVDVYGTVGSVCIYDYGADDIAMVYFSREGAPMAGHETFLPSPSYIFQVQVSGWVGDVYDGETLQQSAFETPLALTAGYFYNYVFDASSFSEVSRLDGNFDGTFKLLP